MASEKTFDEDFHLVNEFENLTNDNQFNNGKSKQKIARDPTAKNDVNLDLYEDEDEDSGSDNHVNDEDDETDDVVNISQMNSSNKETTRMKKKVDKLKSECKKQQTELEIISNLKQELRSNLNAQNEIVEKNQQIFNTLKQQTTKHNQVLTSLKKEIESLKTAHLSVEEEKKKLQNEFEKIEKEKKDFAKPNVNNLELKNMGGKLNKKASEFYSKSEDLNQQLNRVFSDNNNDKNTQLQEDIARIRQLRLQQEELLRQAKTQSKPSLTKLDITQAYCCKDCGTQIGLDSEVESRTYQIGQATFGETKQGYLFKNAYNLVLGNTKIENFTSGSYTIAWVSCVKCTRQMGWKYVQTDNLSNSSKVGKYCLARGLLVFPTDPKENDPKN